MATKGTLHILKHFAHNSGCHWKPGQARAARYVLMPCEVPCHPCVWDLDHFIQGGQPATDLQDSYHDPETGEILQSLEGYVRFEPHT